MRYPGFVGPAYQLPALMADAQQCINWFPEKDESGQGKAPYILRSRPGYDYYDNAPKSPIRAMLQTDTALYVVADDTLYELDTLGSWTSRGSVGTDASDSPAQIIANGTQLLIISAGDLYYDNGSGATPVVFGGWTGTVDTVDNLVTWVSGDTFESTMEGKFIDIGGVLYAVSYVTDSTTLTIVGSAGTTSGTAYSFPVPTEALTGCFIGGYGIINPPDSRTFYISGLYDFTSWDALDVAVKEGYPDNITRLFANDNQLWLLGQETTEIWQNTGNGDFPFERTPSGYIQIGCVARWAVNQVSGGVAWISRDARGVAYAVIALGFTPKRISTHAIEQVWASYSDVTDAESFTYFYNGHEFWQINFPSANAGAGATWVYDATEGLWHQQAHNGAVNRHPARFFQYWLTQKLALFSEYNSGDINVMSSSYTNDDGVAITRRRRAPWLADENKFLFHSLFTLDAQKAASGTVSMRYSPDAVNWSTAKTASLTASRVQWRRLGRARKRVYEIETTADADITLMDAFLEIQPGTN